MQNEPVCWLTLLTSLLLKIAREQHQPMVIVDHRTRRALRCYLHHGKLCCFRVTPVAPNGAGNKLACEQRYILLMHCLVACPVAVP